MKRKFVLIVLALMLAFGAVSVVNAKVTSASVAADRTSNTSASTSASANFDGIKDSVKCTITLQEKYNGSWRTATGLSKTRVSKTKTDTTVILLSSKFTLKKGKVYRIKAKFTDKKGSRTTSSTYYSGSF